MNLETKIDLILQQLNSLNNTYSEKFNQIDKRFEQIDKRFNQIDKRFEQIDKRFEQIDKKFEQIDKRFDNLETKVTHLEADNKEEHAHIMELLTSLNSAFLKYETDGLDKIRILFDADDDRRNHQDIYGHEFQRLNNLVAKNSFRISNLEQHIN